MTATTPATTTRPVAASSPSSIDSRYRILCADLGIRFWIFFNSNGTHTIPVGSDIEGDLNGEAFSAVMELVHAHRRLRDVLDQENRKGV